MSSSKGSGSIRVKPYSHEILLSLSRSGNKPSMKLIMGRLAELFRDEKLVNWRGVFLLADREAEMVIERERSIQVDGWKHIKIDDDAKVILKSLKAMSGIPVYHLADHGIRLVRDLKLLSVDRKGLTRLRDAIDSSKLGTLKGKDQLKKIEPIDSEIHKTNEKVIQVRSIARDRVRSKRKVEPVKIKLLLSDFKDFGLAIRHALNNYYRWNKFNVNEVRELMNRTLINLNPVTHEIILKYVPDVRGQNYLKNKYISSYLYGTKKMSVNKAHDFYMVIGKEWSCPSCFVWIKRFLKLWESSHTKGELIRKYYTVREWFNEVDIDFPPELEDDADMVITNREDLERTGLFEDLDLKIKNILKIADRIEYAYLNYFELDKWEQTEIKIIVNSSDGYAHPYAQLIRERLKKTEDENER